MTNIEKEEMAEAALYDEIRRSQRIFVLTRIKSMKNNTRQPILNLTTNGNKSFPPKRRSLSAPEFFNKQKPINRKTTGGMNKFVLMEPKPIFCDNNQRNKNNGSISKAHPVYNAAKINRGRSNITPKQNLTSLLRSQLIKTTLNEIFLKEQEEKKLKLKIEMRHLALRQRYLEIEKTLHMGKGLKIDQMRKRIKESLRLSLEYTEFLDELYAKVAEYPTLVERQMKLNAEQLINKQICNILKHEGINELD